MQVKFFIPYLLELNIKIFKAVKLLDIYNYDDDDDDDDNDLLLIK